MPSSLFFVSAMDWNSISLKLSFNQRVQTNTFLIHQCLLNVFIVRTSPVPSETFFERLPACHSKLITMPDYCVRIGIWDSDTGI